MFNKDLEDKYQEVKKAVAINSIKAIPPLVALGVFVESPVLCLNSIIILGGISFCTFLIWIGEIFDFGQASKAGRVI